MKHLFKYHAHDLKGLFAGTRKLSTFCTKLEKQAQQDDTYDRDKYVGDGFEFFVELLVTLLPFNRKMGGLYAYEPVQENDTGADGRASNWDGKPSLIQVKYRSNKQGLLTANKDHLSNLLAVAVKEGIVKADLSKEAHVFYVFTTAKGLHYYTDDTFFENNVHCVAYDDIRLLVDNNEGFWQACENIVNTIEDERSE